MELTIQDIYKMISSTKAKYEEHADLNSDYARGIIKGLEVALDLIQPEEEKNV